MSNLTNDDISAWKALASSVKPIKHDAIVTIEAKPGVRTSHIRKTGNVPYVRDERITENIPGIERKVSREIRQGKLKTEARIDLHGYTVTQAHQMVTTFLTMCYSEHRRKVLVITGNGELIRREFPHWVETNPLREFVISCTVAHQRQGGNGAFIVILKKPK